ncbi:Uncharacterised protein [Vibrio cholerae]|nr:Uncharacterised protein [Vibrio cholerae]CSI89572.1 Uncharacterised protein [Vibrio cholerae]
MTKRVSGKRLSSAVCFLIGKVVKASMSTFLIRYSQTLPYCNLKTQVSI